MRTLIYDIETSPIVSYNWGIWEQNAIEVIEDWQILSVAWKWLGEKKIHVIGQDDFKDYVPGINDDTNVVKTIHKLYTEADVVIAHNGDKFDQRKSQARMMIRGLAPPAPYKQIDTQKTAKRFAAFTSNSLKDLAKSLDVSRKGDAGGFETWKGCLAGDKKAWKKLKQYNKQDIPPLEEIYLKMRPWIQNHPPQNVIDSRPDACPKCGGTHIQSRGIIATKTQSYRQFQCMGCLGWIRSRVPEFKQAPERMQYV